MVEGERLTAKQADALREELAHLEGPRRVEVVAAIKTAREFGDLSENFEYHAAKNEQGLLERKIAILRARLRDAEIVDESVAAERGVAGVGSHVELERDDGETMVFEISSVGGVSPESPVGKAVIGKAVGDEVTVEAPRGAWRATVRKLS